MSEPERPAGEPKRWLDERRNVDRVFHLLVGVCAALVAADLLYAKHGHFAFEDFVGFHAGFGFVAYVSLILTAKGLRRLTKRREDYYDA